MSLAIAVKLDVDSATLEYRLLQHMESFRDAQVMPAGPDGHDILAVEIRGTVESMAPALASARKADPEGEIYLFAPVLDPDVILEALRQGVREILPVNCSRELMHQALHRHVGRRKKKEKIKNPRKLARVISVIGAKGGVGTTTLAVNLARELARRPLEKGLALVDLDLPSGDMSVFLGLEALRPTSSRPAQETAPGVGAMLDALPAFGEGAAAILFPEHLPAQDRLSSSLYDMVAKLRERFDLLVIDLGSDMDEMRREIMKWSSHVLFVGVQSVPCIVRMRRFYTGSWLRDDILSKTRIILNRTVNYSNISAEDMQEALGQKIYWQLAEDYAGTLKAINQGKALRDMSPRPSMSRGFEKLATALWESEESEHQART